jgi:hypothetical protein
MPIDYNKLFNPNSMNQNTPEQQTALNVALVNALSETQDIVADSTNPFHRSQYASLAKHLEVLKPIFKKHGLAILQFPIGSEGAVGIRTIIVHNSGASVEADALIPADKEMSGQDAGSIYSYVRRYSLASVAGVATEDCDAETNRIAKSGSKPSAPATKAVARPNATVTAKPAPAGFVAVAPFGDRKGTPLSELPLTEPNREVKFGDLNYFANRWTPKPFGDNTTVSAKDANTKAEAVRLWNASQGGADATAPETSDDVPF